MGLLTWIIIGVLILVVIGIGWQTFFSGILDGAKKVGDSPLVRNATGEAKDLVKSLDSDIARALQ